MILRNFDELIGVAKVRGRRRVAVAGAGDKRVLEGLRLAWNEELIDPILYGDGPRIRELIATLDLPAAWTVCHVDGENPAYAVAAVEGIKKGEAEFLMKGQMPTHSLFSAVLDRKNGLEHEGILSHIALVEIEDYSKLFGTTDGGLTLKPNFEQKCEIVRNTIRAFHRLGYARPKIGLLSYVEKVTVGDEETEDWQRISQMALAGDFGEAAVEGPFGYDLCLSEEAKQIKGVDSEVAADVDAIVAPNITACNASTKALILRGGRAAGIVVGAQVPIVALSRSDTPRIRLYSIAAGIAMLSQVGQ